MPPRGQEMSGNICWLTKFGSYRVEAKMLINTLQCTRQHHTTKYYPVPNVHSAHVKDHGLNHMSENSATNSNQDPKKLVL